MRSSWGGAGAGESALSAAVLVASHAGVTRTIRGVAERARVWAVMRILAPLSCAVFGYMPGRRIGLGEDLPRGVMLQWSRWTTLPHYFYDDPAIDAARRAASVRIPLLMLGFDDDPWANPRPAAGGAMTLPAKAPRFVLLVNRAQRAIGHWIERRPEAWDGISPAQVGLLFLPAARNEAPVGEIAQALDVAPAAVTNLSKRVQAANLVERVGDAQDGRLTRLRLTPAGAAACTTAHAVLDQLNARLLQGFTADEQAVVARWLNHAAVVMSEGDKEL
ncbi:MAG: hypothetical protein V7631_3972 [Massilia sp.]|jgi:DNA-binding MarR family transcriptional regulator